MESNHIPANSSFTQKDTDTNTLSNNIEDSEILTQFKNIHTEEDHCFEAKTFLS